MKVETTLSGTRAALRQARKAGKTIAFVPTMGNLHEGHIQLVKKARIRADFVAVSIFVNPTQFGAGEDFDKYPRTLEADSAELAEARCDLLFAPTASEMYPDGRSQSTVVTVSGLDTILCGRSRPGHFAGVATVVSKLFNIVQPDLALFGEKDYQQLAVIRRLTHELCLPIDIVGVPTIRAADGLALSSRNGYLTPELRLTAPALYQTLQSIKKSLESGQNDYVALCGQGNAQLAALGFVPDYLEIWRQDLTPAQPGDQHLVVLVAARLGTTRLIDNLTVDR